MNFVKINLLVMSIMQKDKNSFLNSTDGTPQNSPPEDEIPHSIFEDKFPHLFNLIPAAITYVDKNHHLLYANAAFKKMFTCDFNAVEGKPIIGLLGQHAYEASRIWLDAALAGEEVNFEMEVTFKGDTRYIETNYRPDFDKSGNVLGIAGIMNDITQKKQAAIKLKNKNEELQDYVENASIALHWVDADGIILWANKAELKMLGYSEQEYIGNPIANFHADKDKINHILSLLANEEVVQDYEATLIHKDGSNCTVLINSSVLWENGKFVHTRCFTTNINDRKLLEDSLQKSKDRFQLLMENIPAALYTCDAQGRITLYNQAAADLWGRHPELGKDFYCGSLKIFYPDGITPMPLDSCPMALTLKEGQAVKGKEIVIERPDGKRIHVQVYPVPLLDNAGKVLGAVNMLMDISESKIAENKLAYLAAIVHSSSDPIIGITLDGIVTSWNEAAERVFGYSMDEMVGETLFKIIPEDLLEEEYLLFERLKKGEMLTHVETKRRTKEQSILDVSVTLSPIKNNEGYIIGASKILRDITAQKIQDEALRESEERLRMAIQTTLLGTWEYYPLTGILNWSEECKNIYDAPHDLEVDYSFFSKHIHPEDADFAQQAISNAMKAEADGNYDIQYRILRYSDHATRWIRTKGKVYFNLNRQPERFIGTVLDITEEKQQEQELKNSVELFTSMADNVPAMIWMSGDDKFADFFNKTWLEFTGRTIEQEKNEGWVQNVHPDDAEKCLKDYRDSYKRQVGFYTEYRLRRHDGQYRWIADNSVPRHNQDGSFAGFISACIDIDDQKNFSEKILESELKLKTISNASPVGLWMTDINAQCSFVNDTWIKWTGAPFEQQMGTGWMMKVLEEDKANAHSMFWESMLKREKYSAGFRINRADGQLRWCLTEGEPYYDIDGAFAGYAGSVTDITDIRKMEERKDDFIKMASHELKTPITSIKGYIQLLLNIYDDANEEKFETSKPMVKTFLNTIAKQVSKLTWLVSELLDLSRIELGKLELNKTSFNLEELIEETAQEAHHTSTRHKISIHHFFKGNVFADKDRISQVLLNLLTNAIKYSPNNDSIEISVEGNDTFVSIKVKDHGIGINKKDHQMIFQRFYRVEGKSEQTYPGFGIGLFISNEIIQRHNGSIFVESNADKGSVFTITLPIGL